jgi:hypothetical protein
LWQAGGNLGTATVRGCTLSGPTGGGKPGPQGPVPSNALLDRPGAWGRAASGRRRHQPGGGPPAPRRAPGRRPRATSRYQRRCVGPERAGDFGLRADVDGTPYSRAGNAISSEPRCSSVRVTIGERARFVAAEARNAPYLWIDPCVPSPSPHSPDPDGPMPISPRRGETAADSLPIDPVQPWRDYDDRRQGVGHAGRLVRSAGGTGDDPPGVRAGGPEYTSGRCRGVG